MTFDCEFCSAVFSTKSNLMTHQKRAKKCLEIRNAFSENSFECNYCTKQYTSKQTLFLHLEKCPEKKAKELDESSDFYKKILEEKDSLIKEKTTLLRQSEKALKDKDKQIESLMNQLFVLQGRLGDIAEIGAKKETTTYKINNIVNQLVPYDLDKQKIRTIVNEKFTENHLYAKENGIVNFAFTNLLKDEEGNLKMTCTDTARKIFIYKDKDGNLYKDPNCVGFMETYIPAITHKSYSIISEKDDNEMLELSECIMNIEPSTISTKLASKLVPKPT
jgi:hypothetical protein